MKNEELQKKERVEIPLEPEREGEGPPSKRPTGPGEPTEGRPPTDGGDNGPDKTSEGFPWGRVLRLLLVAAFVIVLILVVWLGLRGQERGPIVSVACRDGVVNRMGAGAESLSGTKFLVEREIILTGPSDRIDALVEQLKRPDLGSVELNPVRTCELGDLDRLARSPGLDSTQFPFPGDTGDSLAMNLYQVADTQSVGEVVARINGLGRDENVFADANYLTGLMGRSQCGDPFEPVGSPFEPVGSPFEPVGSPFEPVGSPTGAITIATDLFWEQWAFEHIGVDPSYQEMFTETASIPYGAGVRVGVFDTSPLPLSKDKAFSGEGYEIQAADAFAEDGVQASATISWVTPTLEMMVAHPGMPDFTATLTTAVPVSGHGLFVAGLIHAVAPESDIQLVRVLDDYGCGDLYTLNEALYRFIQQVQMDTSEPEGAVANLSLGVNKPTLSEMKKRAFTETARAQVEDEDITILITDTIESLRAVVSLAESNGIVVVAAAGNDSFSEGKPWPPHIPARYPYVIGVAASNIYRERACFSNWGDVYAPGGDALTSTLGSRACATGPDRAKSDDTTDSGEEDADVEAPERGRDDAVISLAWSFPSHYGYWRGTSFATPLVSGLAALVLEAGEFDGGAVRFEKVVEAIRCGAPRGDGVINAPATLLRCLP